MMVARISKLPYIGTPLERSLHTMEASTKIPALEPDVKPVMVQLWVVVLSAMAGAIILLLLIYVFYKVKNHSSINIVLRFVLSVKQYCQILTYTTLLQNYNVINFSKNVNTV